MIPFLKLIRWPNLLIMAFTQYMVRWCLFAPVNSLMKSDIGYGPMDTQLMPELDFFLLVLSTIMIGAAGYIINDYFDVRIDEVNRPSTNLVGKMIKRRVAIAAHTTFNVLGVLIGAWLSYKYHIFRVGVLIYITAPALLWFYSTNLKRQFLIGNVVIALLSGLVPLIVALFEKQNIVNYIISGENNIPQMIREQSANYLLTDMHVAFVLGLFAFIISLLREIIKDVEDYEGDLEYGCKTMPIVIGIARTKIVLAGITAAVIAGIGWLQYGQIGSSDWVSFSYFTVFLQLPLVYLIYRMFTSKGKSDWRFASTLVKIIMVAGISFLFLYAHEMHNLIAGDVS